MKIERLEIQNFRSFATFDLDLGGRSLFVIAENGGGKSSLLTAIARGLGRDLSFTRSDFADPASPIVIRVTLADLNAAQRGVFANYVEFGPGPPKLQLEARAIWNSVDDQADIEHSYVRVAGSRSRRDEREAIPLQWLPAGRDAGRILQLGVAQNLMGQFIEDLPIQASVDRAIDGVRQASEDFGRDPQLDAALRRARDRLAELLPDVPTGAFTLGASAITARELLRQFDLLVAYGADPIGVSRQSSGIAQLSVFVFAMLLAESDPGRILLVDEPEISLHPQAQRALMRGLAGLNAQVLVATHSSNLLDRADPRSVIRLKRTPGAVAIVTPSSLTDAEARHLARFTSPQTAEAFFARTAVLVEGLSDQIALEALAQRRGRNLDAEGVAIVHIGGAPSIGAFMRLFGPAGFDLNVAGLCDDAEESWFVEALEAAGHPPGLSRAQREAVGFFVCIADLEDELIRAIGAANVEALIVAHGEGGQLQLFQQQPTIRGLPRDEQLRKFLGSRGRKIEYAPVLVDALDLNNVPAALDGLLSHV